MKNNYVSVLCDYCICTEYGSQAVGTGPWNICEGAGCSDAFDKYKAENPDAEDTTIEEMF